MTSDPTNAELSILSISEDFVPSPTPIPSQQVTLAFDGLLNPPLVLQTNETQCGGKLWPAGMVLAEYLLRNKMAEVQGKKMFVRSDADYFVCSSHLPRCGFIVFLLMEIRIELGAGSGLVGLALARALDHSTDAQPTSIFLTDGHPPLLPLLQHNIDLNKPNLHPSTSLTPDVLSWGEPLSSTIPNPPDILLAADCCYLESNVPLLVGTMETLMGEGTVCFFCYKRRRRADREVVRRLGKMFAVEEVKREWDRDGVFLYEIRQRKTVLHDSKAKNAL